jgi:hypothetical protein
VTEIAQAMADITTLASLLDRGESIPTPAALAMLRQIGGELAAMHARGEMHGALSPHAVYAVGADRWSLEPGLGNDAALLHPEAYWAPEQRHGGAVLDDRSDQYALAIVVYEVLTGKRREDTSDPTAHLAAVNEVELIPGRRLRPDIGPAANDVLRRALARDPEHRFNSIDEFVAAIEREHTVAVAESAAALQHGPPAPRPAVVLATIVGLAAVAVGLTLAVSRGARDAVRDQATVLRADFREWSERRDGRGRPSLIRAPSTGARVAAGGNLIEPGLPGTMSPTGAVATPSGGAASSPSPAFGQAPGPASGPGSGGASAGGASAGAPAAAGDDGDGYLNVTAPSGVAFVVVDRRPHGPPPTVIAARPGRHTVRLVGVGRYTPATIEVEVAAGDTATVAFEAAAEPPRTP